MTVAQDIGVYQSMSALAGELGAVNLAQGVPEPAYDARWRAAIGAELAGTHFQYTPARGIPAVHEAVRAHYRIPAQNIVVTSGCTEALAVALFGLAALGHQTAVWLAPYYSYYPGLAEMAGMRWRTVRIDLTDGTPRLDTGRLAAVLAESGDRAVFLLNSPHNPSGLALDAAGWSEILRIVQDTDCFVLLDDAYRDFRYGAPEPPYAALLDTGRAAVAGAVSKSFAATGVRLGWLLSAEELDPLAERAHMHLSNCAPDVLQRAAVRMMRAIGPELLEETTRRYRRKRDALVTSLKGAGLRTVTPGGGHFVMAVLPGAKGSGTELARGLAYGAGVVPLPLETFFDMPDLPWLRFSFAVPEGDLAVACERLAAFKGATE